MYLLVLARKGINNLQLAAQIGVTQSRRGSCSTAPRGGNDPAVLSGFVEIDEAFIGLTITTIRIDTDARMDRLIRHLINQGKGKAMGEAEQGRARIVAYLRQGS